MKTTTILGILIGLLAVHPCFAGDRDDLLRELDRKDQVCFVGRNADNRLLCFHICR